MENEKVVETMKKYAELAKEERGKNPHNVVVNLIDALIEANLLDEDGNIIERPENTGKQK